MKQPNGATEIENSKYAKTKSQSSKRKVFEIILKNFDTIGISANLANQSYPFNGTILSGFFILGVAIYFSFVYIIYDAETFAEYTQSIYMGSLLTFIAIALLILVLNVKKLFEFVNHGDDLVNTSK